jgi:hypothetical protein
LHVAERGGSSHALKVRRGVDVSAFDDELLHDVESWVVSKNFSSPFFIRAIFPVSGAMFFENVSSVPTLRQCVMSRFSCLLEPKHNGSHEASIKLAAKLNSFWPGLRWTTTP